MVDGRESLYETKINTVCTIDINLVGGRNCEPNAGRDVGVDRQLFRSRLWGRGRAEESELTVATAYVRQKS